jgi:hypothetical protein
MHMYPTYSILFLSDLIPQLPSLLRKEGGLYSFKPPPSRGRGFGGEVKVISWEMKDEYMKYL